MDGSLEKQEKGQSREGLIRWDRGVFVVSYSCVTVGDGWVISRSLARIISVCMKNQKHIIQSEAVSFRERIVSGVSNPILPLSLFYYFICFRYLIHKVHKAHSSSKKTVAIAFTRLLITSNLTSHATVWVRRKAEERPDPNSRSNSSVHREGKKTGALRGKGFPYAKVCKFTSSTRFIHSFACFTLNHTARPLRFCSFFHFFHHFLGGTAHVLRLGCLKKNAVCEMPTFPPNCWIPGRAM